jgi:phage terminase Nu1 subunit (DNA packaging protein)
VQSVDALSRAGSESEFAALVGITQPRVAQLKADGVLSRDGSLLTWCREYCERLREQAAGRLGRGELNVADENAALARERRLGLEIDNARKRGEFAPVTLLTETMAAASKTLADRLDALPVMLARQFPAQFTPEARDAMAAYLSSARNEWAEATVSIAVENDSKPALALVEEAVEE